MSMDHMQLLDDDNDRVGCTPRVTCGVDRHPSDTSETVLAKAVLARAMRDFYGEVADVPQPLRLRVQINAGRFLLTCTEPITQFWTLLAGYRRRAQPSVMLERLAALRLMRQQERAAVQARADAKVAAKTAVVERARLRRNAQGRARRATARRQGAPV